MQCPKEKGQANYDLQVEFAYTKRAIRTRKLKATVGAGIVYPS
jgi:hypothetical protein